jgi:Fic family protein
MSDPETNTYALDAAYKPFPTFAEWASRTSVDTVRWDRYNAALKDKANLSAGALNRALEIVKRAAAIDTGAIEGLYEVDRGFTFTVAFETLTWELELVKKGENVRPLFEAQLHAYDYVLDLATKSVPISEVAIRTLHEVVCRAQETYRVQTPPFGFQEQKLPKGVYKLQSNHVYTRDGSFHSYAPADVTPIEMARLVNELRGDAFLAAHPVLQAAYAHYGLVVIHPFADGNGRVARALAAIFTYRAISMPIMILTDHKESYYDALEAADSGNYQRFVDFMLARSLDTITLVHESVLGAEVPTPEEAAKAINNLYLTKGGYTQGQVDAAGDELFRLALKELAGVSARFNGPNFMVHAVALTRGDGQIEPGRSHRLMVRDERESRFLHVEASSSSPARARLSWNFAVIVPTDASGDDDIRLVRVLDRTERHVGQPIPVGFPSWTEMVFSARLDELIPSPSGVLSIRVGLFAERIIGETLAELKSAGEKALGREF